MVEMKGESRCDRDADASDEPLPRDAGFTLIEAVIVLALMVIVVLPIMTAVTTSVRASATNRAAAQVETAIVNAYDRVNRAPKRCDYTVFVQAAVLTQGWPADRASVQQQYYVPGASPAEAGTWMSGAAATPGCATTSPTDGLVQRVTITVTSLDGKVQRSIQVVKSDV